jgi:ADP-ribose pyrophosphatase
MTKTQHTRQDIDIIEKKTVYQGFFTLNRCQLKFRYFNGAWSPIVVRELFEPGLAVGVLVYDPAMQQIALVEQMRMGAYQSEKGPWLLEIIAGRVDPAEQTAATARREAKEEANIVIDRLTPMCDYWVSPGCSSERVHLFLGEADLSQAGGVHGLSSEHEDIRTQCIPVGQIKTLLETGRVDNAISIIALQWFCLNVLSQKRG